MKLVQTGSDMPLRLVQMPTDLLHLEDRDLDAAGVDPSLLGAFRSYVPRALDDRRGVAILAPAAAGSHYLLVVLARQIGVALRDANIHLRDAGGDLKVGRQKLCYLPGRALSSALAMPDACRALAGEAACFFQDLDQALPPERPDSEARSPDGLSPDALLRLLDERLAGGRPTFLTAAPDRLPPGLETGLRARLLILEPTVSGSRLTETALPSA